MNRRIRTGACTLGAIAFLAMPIATASAQVNPPVQAPQLSGETIDLSGREALQASKLIDQVVRGDGQEDLGTVNDVLFDRDGRLIGLVIGAGNFLGMGEKDVVMPVDRFSISTTTDGHYDIRLNATRGELETAPAFKAPINRDQG
jgi:hypothetical protein